jgi:hypothetical protein
MYAIFIPLLGGTQLANAEEIECERGRSCLTHLTSPKAAGKSAVMAPPKRSTCLKVAIPFALVMFDDFSFVVVELNESIFRVVLGPMS